MSGASYTTLNTGSGGDNVYSEDIGGSPVVKMPACKIHTGALGVDGGVVSSSNPFSVLCAGQAQQAVAASTTVVNPSDYTLRTTDAAPGGVAWSSFTPISVAAAGGQIQGSAGTRYLRRLLALNLHTASVNVAIFNGAGTWGTITNLLDFFSVGASTAANPRDYVGGGIAAPSGIFCLMSTGVWTAAIAAPGAGIVFLGLSV